MEERNRQIILIGGAPTAGKSEAGKKLAAYLNFPWISTDTIREMMREIVDKERFPELFHVTNYGAEEYLTAHTPAQIVANQNKESEGVWRGVKALIDTDYVWKSFIVEGVAILPELVRRDFGDDGAVRAIFLAAAGKEKIREIVFERGLWDDADKYPDPVKEVEVEWASLFNEWLCGEAQKYNYPVYKIDDLDSFAGEIIKSIK